MDPIQLENHIYELITKGEQSGLPTIRYELCCSMNSWNVILHFSNIVQKSGILNIGRINMGYIDVADIKAN